MLDVSCLPGSLSLSGPLLGEEGPILGELGSSSASLLSLGHYTHCPLDVFSRWDLPLLSPEVQPRHLGKPGPGKSAGAPRRAKRQPLCSDLPEDACFHPPLPGSPTLPFTPLSPALQPI